jgi:hypothetical protein
VHQVLAGAAFGVEHDQRLLLLHPVPRQLGDRWLRFARQQLAARVPVAALQGGLERRERVRRGIGVGAVRAGRGEDRQQHPCRAWTHVQNIGMSQAGTGVGWHTASMCPFRRLGFAVAFALASLAAQTDGEPPRRPTFARVVDAAGGALPGAEVTFAGWVPHLGTVVAPLDVQVVAADARGRARANLRPGSATWRGRRPRSMANGCSRWSAATSAPAPCSS